MKILRTQEYVFCYTAKQEKKEIIVLTVYHTRDKIIECPFAETEDIFLHHEGTSGNHNQEGMLTNVIVMLIG